jgi:hypothetical protein
MKKVFQHFKISGFGKVVDNACSVRKLRFSVEGDGPTSNFKLWVSEKESTTGLRDYLQDPKKPHFRTLLVMSLPYPRGIDKK